MASDREIAERLSAISLGFGKLAESAAIAAVGIKEMADAYQELRRRLDEQRGN